MPLEGVIFDWGGTLTLPIEVVYELDTWGRVADRLAPDRRDDLVERLAAMESQLWEQSRVEHSAARLDDLIERAVRELGLDIAIGSLKEAADHHLDIVRPHIEHDADALQVLGRIRDMGLSVGLLSNTIWPASFHDDLLGRDGLKDMFDARFYTSEMSVTKPHPDAFKQALDGIGVLDPRACVFVGDRPWDDIYGASRAGMRTVLRPNELVPTYDVTPDGVIDDLPSLLGLLERWSDEAVGPGL